MKNNIQLHMGTYCLPVHQKHLTNVECLLLLQLKQVKSYILIHFVLGYAFIKWMSLISIT